MDSANQIMIKFTSNFPHLFDNMQKYLPLINNVLRVESQNKLYMETIHEGLLFIYKDFHIFFLMNKPYPPKQITNFLRSINEPILSPFLLFENILSPSTFPSKGVQFRYQIYSSKKKEIADMLSVHFTSFLHEDVKRLEHRDFDLILLLTKFENIVAYNNLVVSMYSGILTQENNPMEKAAKKEK